jgi:hypothetical protein
MIKRYRQTSLSSFRDECQGNSMSDSVSFLSVLQEEEVWHPLWASLIKTDLSDVPIFVSLSVPSFGYFLTRGSWVHLVFECLSQDLFRKSVWFPYSFGFVLGSSFHRCCRWVLITIFFTWFTVLSFSFLPSFPVLGFNICLEVVM